MAILKSNMALFDILLKSTQKPVHYVANTGRFRILMLRRFAKPLEGPAGSGYPPIWVKKEWDV